MNGVYQENNLWRVMRWIPEIKKNWKACRYSLSGMNGVLRSFICFVTWFIQCSHQNQKKKV